MHFLEIAVQNVRGFSPAVRVPLAVGYQWLKSPGDVPAPLAGLAVALCYPDARGGEAAYLAPGQPSGKAGFSCFGQDEQTYRLVRELGAAGSLHKMGEAAFELLTQDGAEIGSTLREAVGFPSRTVYEQLFTFSDGAWPSRAAKGPAAPATAGRPKPASRDEVAQAQGKLAALETELSTSREVAKIQFKMDGINGELYKLDTTLRAYLDAKQRYEDARVAAESAPTPQSLGLPDDIVERVKQYPDLVKRKKEALAKFEAESVKAGVGYVATGPKAYPVWKEQNFQIAVGAGVVGLLAGAFLPGVARYLALIGLPSFGYAALMALQYVEDLKADSGQGAKSSVFEGREKRIREEFDAQIQLVEHALSLATVPTRDEFVTMMNRGEDLRATQTQLQMELADFDSDPENSDIEARAQGMRAEQESLNDRLLQLSGGYIRDSKEIEKELRRVREVLGISEGPAVEGFSGLSTSDGAADPTPALMAAAAELFARDIPTIWGGLQERYVQYLGALTEKRYHGAEVDPGGNARLLAPGRVVPVGDAPPADADMHALALKLTILEKYSVRYKVPVIFEDTVSKGFDEARLALFHRMLKHLGTLTQVLHVTGVRHNGALGESAISV